MKNEKEKKMLEHQKQVKDDNTKRLLKVIRTMQKKGEKITISSVAANANVTRQTIYRNEIVKQEIDLLRGESAGKRPASSKKAKPQSEIIKDLQNRIKELEEEKRLLILQLVIKEEKKIKEEDFEGDKT